MPTFDEHLARLNDNLLDTVRDRIVDATSLSSDRKAFAVPYWIEPEHTKRRPDPFIHAYAQDEGGCQIYVKFPPKKVRSEKGVHWSSRKKHSIRSLSEEDLLSLKSLRWYPNDPVNPLTALARCL